MIEKIESNESSNNNEQDKDLDAMFTSSRKRRLAFSDILIERHLQDPKSFTELDIREEVDTFMFEGHDTTSVSMIYTLYLFGKYPKIQERVQQEIDELFDQIDNEDKKDPHLTMNQLREMKFLEACIKESLRLYPSVPIIARKASDDIDINGKVIPKDCTIIIFIYGIQRDPEFFSKPEKFIPDRFMENSEYYVRNPYAYVPFSAGPRNCIGQKFAFLEEKVVLANILRNFNLKSTQNIDELIMHPEMVLRPQMPINICFTPRR